MYSQHPSLRPPVLGLQLVLMLTLLQILRCNALLWPGLPSFLLSPSLSPSPPPSPSLLTRLSATSPSHTQHGATFPDLTATTTTTASTTSSNSNTSQAKERLRDWFSGDFDNYRQVLEDRQQGLVPREGGGHEHFHCTLVPLNDSSRLAAFYFDGNPSRIFRFRYYEIVGMDREDQDDEENGQHDASSVEMRLYTLHPELEALLRSHAEDPLLWPALFRDFDSGSYSSSSSSSSIPWLPHKLSRLPKCEISWTINKDPVQHSYALDVPESTQSSVHAVMVHGEAIVNSTIVHGMQIKILDQLSLYENVFYINDRGFNPITGAFIYGNQRGVPYRLQRVCHIERQNKTSPGESQLLRQVIDPELEWTLGPQWRIEEDYQAKLDAIGGPSAGINQKSLGTKPN